MIPKEYEIDAEFFLDGDQLMYRCRMTTWRPREWYGKTVQIGEWIPIHELEEQLKTDLKK